MARRYSLPMRTNPNTGKSDPAPQSPAKQFVPLLCPQCEGIIGEMASGQVRLLCVKCKLKTIYHRLESAKLPGQVVYLVIAPSDEYTPG